MKQEYINVQNLLDSGFLSFKCRIPSGGTSTEAHSQTTFIYDDTANVQSRELDVRETAAEAGDIQLRKRDTTNDNVSALYTSNTFKLKCLLASA